MNIDFELIDPHQTQFVNSDKRYILNSGGVGSGKTFSICLRALNLILQYPGIFGLIGAQTYPLLRDTTLREFLNICPSELIKSYNKTEQHFIFLNNSELIFRSFDDANKLKSLNLGFAGIEEMTDTTEDIFKMLRTRMRQQGMPGCIFGATNPGTFGNWVYKYFIETPITNSEVIYSVSADNDFLPSEFLDDLKEIKKTNPQYYERMVMGKWGALEGLIYNFPMKNRITELPDKRKIHRWVAGLDFGFNHPTALIIAGLREDTYYIYEEVYQRNLTSSDIVSIIKQKMIEYPIEIIYCDSARPEIIEDLQREGIPAEPAIKDVFDGIMYVSGLINDNKVYINQECFYLLRELDSYIWDAKNTTKEVPVKANDDSCFTGDHKVATLRGMIKIKDLFIWDFIYTRYGFHRIEQLSCRETMTSKYQIKNKTITCTDDHPFYSLNKMTFVNVSDLTNKDMLYILDPEEYRKCQYQKLLNLKELNSEDGLDQSIQIIESISPVIAIISNKVFGHYTEKYGNLNLGIFQRIIKFIIKMVIRLIIQLKIWNVSINSIIYRYMRNNGLKNINQKLKNIWIRFGLKLWSGINQRMAGNGILSMLKKFLGNCLISSMNVSYVEYLLKQKKDIMLNSVQTIVNQNIDENRELITLKLNVLDVEKSFIKINMQEKFTVQEVAVVNPIGKGKNSTVYNLKVDRQPEYFIDGILVHNCDALRYMLYSDARNMTVDTIELMGERETTNGW